MNGTYDPALVALSCAIAVLASYVALNLASQIAHSDNRHQAYWLLGGALAMGSGVWSMHFIGMLAFHLPIATSYDIPLTLLSLLAAILASGFALHTVNRESLGWRRLIASGTLLGIGVAAMHFTGMAAMRMSPPIRYDVSLVLASLAVAIGASTVAIHIAFRLRCVAADRISRRRLVSAVIMAAGIVGMHYTGMAAANFAPDSICLSGPEQIRSVWLAATIAACAVLFLAGTMLISPVAARSRRTGEHSFGIRLKLSASYLVISLLVAAFAISALWVQLNAAERLSTLEAEDLGRFVVQTIGDDPMSNLHEVQRMIAAIRRTQDRDVFVVDRNRRVVADADTEEVGMVFTKDRDDAIGLTLQDGKPRTFIEARPPPLADARQLVLPLYENVYQPESHIVGAIVFEYTPIYAALLAQAQSVAYLVGALGVACVFLTAALGLRVASAIASPLGALERGARAIASGQYDARVAVASNDEMGMLGGAFNQMAHDLGASHARLIEHQRELEARVAQRTLEWKQAAASQRESEAEMRLIAEHMPAALCYIDRSMHFRYHNPLFSRLFGGTDNVVDGNALPDVIGPRAFAVIRPSITSVLEGAQTTYHGRRVLSDGEVQYLETTLVPRIDAAGTTIGFYAMTQDVSEGKHAEQALLKGNEELLRSNARLQEARDQLLQAEKMASIGQLASGVAHEINNPIGYVQSNLGTLDRYLKDIFTVLERYGEAETSIGDDAVRRDIAAAKQACDLDFVKDDAVALVAQSKEGISRVTKIVRDLKNFSRSGTDDVWQFSDLHGGLDSTLNIAWNEIKYKANVTKHYGELPLIECRLSQLNQVFMNILVNAAQAMTRHGTIAIRTGRDGDRVWIDFEDTGDGIAPEHLSRIFDPFFTTKPVGKGTGLGLSLAYGIVKEHGGHIDVQSVVGRGTTFRVWLPVTQGSPAYAASPARARSGDEERILTSVAG